MDSSVAGSETQPLQNEHCQPLQALQHSYPQAQESYYSYRQNGSQSATGSENYHSYTSSDTGGAAYRHPPHEASVSITAPPQIAGQSIGYAVPQGPNPAAAAAIAAPSELSELAENMAQKEAANGGVPGPGVGLLQYHYTQAPDNVLGRGMNDRGFSRRGRGRGRGHAAHAGRGQGRGSPNPTPASQTGISFAKTLTTGLTPSQKPVPQIFWCEICFVDCNTLDVLEQHKNGKRHKKTVKKHKEMLAWQKQQLENDTKDTGNGVLGELQNQPEQTTNPFDQTEVIIPVIHDKTNVQEGQQFFQEVTVRTVEQIKTTQEGQQYFQAVVEEKQNVQDGQHNSQEATVLAAVEQKNVQQRQENFQEATIQAIEERENVQNDQQNFQEAAVSGNDLENEQQSDDIDFQPKEMKDKLTFEQPTDALSSPRRGGHAGRHPSKRKMMGSGRGDKKARHSEPMGEKLSKPREQPVVCMICNIKCDTKTVFQSHLAGKKHISRTQRFQGQQATSGPPDFFHENPQYIHTSQGLPPIFYGFQPQPQEESQQRANLQDAPLEFLAQEAQCEHAVDTISESAGSANPDGLNVVTGFIGQEGESAEQNSMVDDMKPDSDILEPPVEGSLASEQ